MSASTMCAVLVKLLVAATPMNPFNCRSDKFMQAPLLGR